MTEANQNFSMYAGETKNIIVPCTKDDRTDLDLTGATLKWTVKQRKNSPTVVFEKVSPDITVGGNVLTIPLKPLDTVNLKGEYYHKCTVEDQAENDSVLFTGTITIEI
jgi:hypothetical protein